MMETQDVGSFSACVCQPDKHVSQDAALGLANFTIYEWELYT